MRSKTSVSYSSEEMKKAKSRTDWARVRREATSGHDPDMSDPMDSEATAAELATALAKKRMGRPLSANRKTPLSLRLSNDVVTYFKATGRGWQTRIDEALREYVKKHRARPA